MAVVTGAPKNASDPRWNFQRSLYRVIGLGRGVLRALMDKRRCEQSRGGQGDNAVGPSHNSIVNA